MKFSEYYKDAVKKTGLSSREFIEKAGISKPLHYFYLTGQRVPTTDTAKKLASALGVEAEDFAHMCRESLGRPKKIGSNG